MMMMMMMMNLAPRWWIATMIIACSSPPVFCVVSVAIKDMEPPDDERRFVIELEFVQCLVNPDYLRCKFIFLAFPHWV